jgi:hypothetical protein
MNEPLNTSTSEVVFTGKSYNKHPQWYNQPLRLTEEQLGNPVLILEDFFQCYHLNETRELLWQWLLAVISSDGSISSEPLERSNQIHFYENLESLIEAAFVLKTNQNSAETNTTSKDNVNSTQLMHLEITSDAAETYNKGKRLIEYVNDDPLYVIKEVFNPAKWQSLGLKEWVEIALVSEDDAYWNADDRQILITFMDHLHLLIESLYIINLQKISDSAKKEWSQKIYTPYLLSKDQAVNPRQVIVEFFDKYPMLYIMRELEDLLEAGISHTGPWRNQIGSPWEVFDIYRDILCLIKSAEQLLAPNYLSLFSSEA